MVAGVVRILNGSALIIPTDIIYGAYGAAFHLHSCGPVKKHSPLTIINISQNPAEKAICGSCKIKSQHRFFFVCSRSPSRTQYYLVGLFATTSPRSLKYTDTRVLTHSHTSKLFNTN